MKFGLPKIPRPHIWTKADGEPTRFQNIVKASAPTAGLLAAGAAGGGVVGGLKAYDSGYEAGLQAQAEQTMNQTA